MSFSLDRLFGGGRQAGFKDLEEQLRQAQEALRAATARGEGFLDPFRAGGTQAMGQLQDLFGMPSTDVINQILGQYQESPAFKFKQQQAQEALQNQLAAAGVGGSGPAAMRAGQLASNIAGQGQEQFLQDVLGARQQRIGGLERLYGGGLGAAGQEAGMEQALGQGLAGLFGQIGQAQFGQDVSKSQQLTNLLSGLGQILGGIGGLPGMSNLFGSGGRASPWMDPDLVQTGPGQPVPRLL
jgi:hypothetical protein